MATADASAVNIKSYVAQPMPADPSRSFIMLKLSTTSSSAAEL
jgi:hypothetical protein